MEQDTENQQEDYYPQQQQGNQYTQQEPRMNTMALVSFVLSFFSFPLALIFGFIALNQIKKTEEKGRGFAIAGIVISFVELALIVILSILIIVLSYIQP